MPETLVDANILVRYLTDEPRELADRAAEMLQAGAAAEMRMVVDPLTVAEVVYVLESVYSWEHQEIAPRLLDFIESSVLVILEHDVVVQALIWYNNVAGLDFEDAYVSALAVSRGHATVMSFDDGLRRVPGLTVLRLPSDIE